MTGRSTEEPSVSWADWYSACLEAGGPLRTRAEVVYFARKAKERVSEDEAELFRLSEPLFDCGHPVRELRLKERLTGQASAAYLLVDRLLERPASAIARLLARAH